MEFWGVEVKNGESSKVVPDENKLIHVSQASLGEVKKEKGNKHILLYVKTGDQKLGLGTLISEKIPQISFDLAFEKEFELTHTGNNGSVFFTGYSMTNPSMDETEEDEYDSEEMILPIHSAAGKSNTEQPTKAKPAASKQKVKIVDPKADGKAKKKDETGVSDEDDSSSDDFEDSEGASGEDMVTMNGEVETSDDEDDDSVQSKDDDSVQSEDDETPKKMGSSKKRPLESVKKTPLSEKKAKFVTPMKTDGKKAGAQVHVDTPHPSKQAVNLPKKEQTKQQTPKSGGDHTCKPCNRSFKTEEGLQSHNKAKHSSGK